MYRLTCSLSLPTICFVAMQKSFSINLAVKNNEERVVTVKCQNDSEIMVELKDQERVVTVICDNYSKILEMEQQSALRGYTPRQAASLAPITAKLVCKHEYTRFPWVQQQTDFRTCNDDLLWGRQLYLYVSRCDTRTPYQQPGLQAAVGYLLPLVWLFNACGFVVDVREDWAWLGWEQRKRSVLGL